MTISDDDREAFAEATRDVRRLKPRNAASLEKPRPKPRALQSRAAHRDVLEQSLAGTVSLDPAETAFRREHVPLQTLRKLRRGQFAIEAEIDLHGMRPEQARHELHDFLRECIERRLSCVRVIHGKGTRSGPAGPILKPSVQAWLSLWDQVLAFVSAQPRHGGNGAVYVLLRRASRRYRSSAS